MLRSTNARRRFGLLASSSLVASTLVAGMGGVALTAFTPAVALAACTPDAAGTTAGGATTPVAATENCTGVDTGVFYVNAGNLAVNFNNELITTNGAGVGALVAGNGNVTLQVVTNTGNVGGVITNSGGTGIEIRSFGSVTLNTGSTGNTALAGAVVVGSTNGVFGSASTTLTLNLLNTVVGGSGSAVIANSAGDIVINAATASGGNVTLSGTTNGITVGTLGGGANDTITAPGTTIGSSGDGISISNVSGTVTLSTGQVVGGTGGIVIAAAGGAVNVTTSGLTSGGTGTGISITGTGGAVTGNIAGDVVGDAAVNVTETGAGTINMTYSGNVTGTLGGVIQTTAAGSNTANVVGNLAKPTTVDGQGNIGLAITATGAGNVLVTSTANTDIVTNTATASAGVLASSNSGSVTVNLAGTVGGAHAVGGDGIDASVAVIGDVSVTAASVNAVGVGINATNGGSGSVVVNAGTTTAGGDGIIASSTDSGFVSVTAGNTTAGGTDGILATSTGSGFVTVMADNTSGASFGINATSGSGAVTVTATGNTVGGIFGIFATTGGTGAVSVTAVNTTGAFTGINATSGSGAVTVTATGNTSGGTDGIFAATGGAGAVTVTSANATGGTDGILATSGVGAVTVTATGNSSGGTDGIFAATGGAGAVTVTSANATGGTDGIFAVSGSGAVTVTATGNTSGGADGIFATTGGLGAVTVTATGNTSGGIDGVFAASSGGPVTVTAGNVTAGSTDVFAVSSTGNVVVNINTPPATGNVTDTFGGSVGELAETGGPGNATVNLGNGVGTTTIHGTNTGIATIGVEASTGSGTALIHSNGNVIVDPTEFALYAPSLTGRALISTGTGDSYTVDDPAFAATQHIGLFATTGATTDTVAGPSVDIEVGANNTINVEANVTSVSADIGIAAVNTGNGSGSVKVGTTGGGLHLTVLGSNAVGIAATTAGTDGGTPFVATGFGNVTVNTGTGQITVGGATTNFVYAASNAFKQSYGIFANTDGGNINIDNNASISVSNAQVFVGFGTAGVGIQATTTGSGNIDIGAPTGGSLITTQNGDGIFATNGFGSGSITVGGGANGVINESITTHQLTAAVNANGIEAVTSGSGSILVSQGAPSTITTTGNLGENVGILASTTGSGSVTVVSAGAITTAAGTGSLYFFGSGTTVGQGIVAATTGNGAVSVTQSGVITTTGTADGIDAVTTGSGSVTVTSSGTINSGGIGALAQTTGTGAATVNLNGAHITSTSGFAGALAFTLDSGTASVLMSGAGSVLADGPFGVAAISFGGGFADVVTAGTVTAPFGAGVLAQGFSSSVDVTANSTVTGLGASTGTASVIADSSFFGGTSAISVEGTVTTVTAAGHSDGDLAIQAGSGTVNLSTSASGKIFGRLNFDNFSNAVTINNAGLWQSSGTSTLSNGSGSVTLNNSGAIVTAQNGAFTNLVFGSGTNTVTTTPTGAFVVGAGAIPGATISGLEATPAITEISGAVTFTNNGVIVLGGSPAASDGKIGSLLFAPNTTLGGTGKIFLDANLWSDTQSAAACGIGALTAADCLVVGATSGNEGIRVKDTGAHPVGAFNPTGIVIVVGSSGAGTFHLDPGSSFFDGSAADAALFGGHVGVINKPGLFYYNLVFNAGDSTERLVSAPKTSLLEFASVGGGITGVWYDTTQTWFDRTTDLRDTLSGRSTGAEPGVWLKAKGDWTHRKGFATSPQFGNFAFNTSFDQDTGGLLGGVDLLAVTNKDQAFVVGVEGGYFDSDLRFAVSPDRFDIQADTFGGYATYLNGGLFVDGTVNANFWRLNGNLPSIGFVPAPVTTKTRGTSIGGQIESGYSMPIGATWFWEPVGSLSYVSSTFDDIPLPGATLKLTRGNSFRGSLGARVGVTSDFQYYKIKLAVTARVWDEFTSDPTSTFIVPGGTNLTNSTNLKGAYGEVSGQANLFSSKSGFSAFLTGGYKFKTNYNEGDVSVGLRQQW